MSNHLQIKNLQAAFSVQDPDLALLIQQLSEQPDENANEPRREGALDFDTFISETRKKSFRKQPIAEQQRYRTERLHALQADDAEVALVERLKLHDILLMLWRDDSIYARHTLLRSIATVKLTYGPWRALKIIFKEAEAKGDTEIYGALAARFDMASAARNHSVSQLTVNYLVRRAWRHLRRTGETLGVCYADAAADVLAHYTDDTQWSSTWVSNHIFYHETGDYSRDLFRLKSKPGTLLKFRAFPDLWRRTPRPLFSLLERAQSEQVRRYATAALRADFRAALREVEPAWVARLVGVRSATIDEFVVWILENVPRFEQAAFRELGLHNTVLALFVSPADAARQYAADYARTHARDLSVKQLIGLANNSHDAVHKLAVTLLQSRDPRTEVGLDAWGELLETSQGSTLATEILRKHFGASELTLEWFKARLIKPGTEGFDFAKQNLMHFHPRKTLSATYFSDLMTQLDYQQYGVRQSVKFAVSELGHFDLNQAVDAEFLKMALINPHITNHVQQWVNEGRLDVTLYPVSFLKALAFHPEFEHDAWVRSLRKQHLWAADLSFSEGLSAQIFEWLGDVRRYSPSQIGFDWLMQLVQRGEPQYHSFAVTTMIKAFLPADFAAVSSQDTQAQQALSQDAQASDATADSTKSAVDLQQASFLFTGKLATMSRSEAEDKVAKAGGANAGSVTKTLDYLVIGDDGSSLYGQGRKGSKQVKAEKLNESGAGIRIISETAFLQMLVGEKREFSTDTVTQGCEQLWAMLTSPGKEDAALLRFALKYIRMHHPDICLQTTDRYVDPGAEIPTEFLSFARVKPLFFERRKPLRDFALELAHWEFARWSPPIEALVELCESPFEDVRNFVTTAMTVEDAHEHKRYRVDPDTLTPEAVYSFCESSDEATRQLGMVLIGRCPRLQLPEELFRLTESPDRRVRGFAVRQFWHWYCDKGVSPGWQPKAPKPAEGSAPDSTPLLRTAPKSLPAPLDNMEKFLRRALFELPPSKHTEKRSNTEIKVKLKPLPACRSKANLIETLRDIAERDETFAQAILPLLQEFMRSLGQSERGACLVAVTRIRHAHSMGQVAEQGVSLQ